MSGDVVCGYSLSGGYGPIPRFLYYILLIVTLLFHRTKWLVDSTLGASMIFSSIAAVHAVALASARGRGTVDLDIIPVYSVTGMGMLIAVPLMVWSKTLREARRSARMIVFLWVGLMFIGIMASLASMKRLPVPLQCDVPDTPGCPLACNVALPMRQGQPIQLISFSSAHFLSNTWAGIFSWYACSVTIMGVLFAHGRKPPLELAKAQLKGRTGSRRFRQKNANRIANCAICLPPLSIGMCIAHVIVLEVILLGPRRPPLGENMTAIGQWGPLVGAAFALLASLIQWNVYEPEKQRDTEQAKVSSSTALPVPESSSPVRSAPVSVDTQSSSPVRSTRESFDTPDYFKGGYWWDTGADALPVLVYRGDEWVVRDGYLRRGACLPEESSSPGHSTGGSFDTPAYFMGGYWWDKGTDVLPVLVHNGVEWVVRDGYLRRIQKQLEIAVELTRYNTVQLNLFYSRNSITESIMPPEQSEPSDEVES